MFKSYTGLLSLSTPITFSLIAFFVFLQVKKNSTFMSTGIQIDFLLVTNV